MDLQLSQSTEKLFQSEADGNKFSLEDCTVEQHNERNHAVAVDVKEIHCDRVRKR